MKKENGEEKISWEINIPLLNNKILIKQTIIVFVITYIIVSILMSFIFILQGDYKAALNLLLIFLIVCFGLFLLSLIVMLIIFGNRMKLKFTIDKTGVLYEMIDTRGKKLTTLAIILGLLSRRSSSTGAGLIAKSQERVFINFKNVYKIDTRDKDKTILLKNEWRTLLAIYCNDENYDKVKNYLKDIIDAKEEKEKKKVIKNPLPKYIFLSIITIIMSIPIFTLQYPFEINLFIPILILFFTLAGIWLLRLLNFVTIIASIYVIIYVIFKIFEQKESTLFGGKYYVYEILSSEDIISLIFLSISLLYFIYFSIYSIKGNFNSMLERDMV
ncbi:MAG: hypothetical protein N3D74_03715 [Caldisericia bacterium]|nr:hypothetical protein [Caldisericia bacterium]